MVNQRSLAAYNLDTGLIDTNFRPNFDGGRSTRSRPRRTAPSCTSAGPFNTVNGVTKRKIARLNPTTGAPVTAFTANPSARRPRSPSTNTTVYIGGQFTTRQQRAAGGLAASTPTTGAVDTGFDNRSPAASASTAP